jgi:hypothetical protein
VGKLDNRLLLMLDVNRLMSDTEQAAVADVAQRSEPEPAAAHAG